MPQSPILRKRRGARPTTAAQAPASSLNLTTDVRDLQSSSWSATASGGIYRDSGNVGVGTANPLYKLHVVGDAVVSQLGVGTSTPPGQKLHVNQGNILIDGTNETGLLIKRNGDVGGFTDPIFTFGRIYDTGIAPGFSIFYDDATDPEKRVFSLESTGTLALIQNGTRRSAYETFVDEGDTYPAFRVTTYPQAALELGPGDGVTDTQVQFRWVSSNTASVTIGGGDKLTINGTTVKVEQGIRLHARGAYDGETWLFSGSQTIGAQQVLLCDASSGAAALSLPTASGIEGRLYTFKNVGGANNVTIDPSGAETIDGAGTLTLTPGQYATIVAAGGNWYRIG